MLPFASAVPIRPFLSKFTEISSQMKKYFVQEVRKAENRKHKGEQGMNLLQKGVIWKEMKHHCYVLHWGTSIYVYSQRKGLTRETTPALKEIKPQHFKYRKIIQGMPGSSGFRRSATGTMIIRWQSIDAEMPQSYSSTDLVICMQMQKLNGSRKHIPFIFCCQGDFPFKGNAG